jgi:hypothetical protein
MLNLSYPLLSNKDSGGRGRISAVENGQLPYAMWFPAAVPNGYALAVNFGPAKP